MLYYSEYPASEDEGLRTMKLRRSPRRKLRGDGERDGEKARFIGMQGVGVGPGIGGEGLLSPARGDGGDGDREAPWGVRAEVVGKGEESGRRSLSGIVEG